MKIARMYIAAGVLTVLTTQVALAEEAETTSTASKYFDANWALFNSNGQPYPPAARNSADISSMYFDANWALLNNDGQPGKQLSERVVSADIR
jgi:hypothetical protein